MHHIPDIARRRIGEYYPGLSPYTPQSMDRLGVSLAYCESRCRNFYDHEGIDWKATARRASSEVRAGAARGVVVGIARLRRGRGGSGG